MASGDLTGTRVFGGTTTLYKDLKATAATSLPKVLQDSCRMSC